MMRTRGVLALADAESAAAAEEGRRDGRRLSALSAYAVVTTSSCSRWIWIWPATGIGPAFCIEVKQPGESRPETFYFIDLRSQRASVRRDRAIRRCPRRWQPIDFVGKGAHPALQAPRGCGSRSASARITRAWTACKPDGRFSR
ncbi:MAG: hypothetical protein R3F43_00770 [bacterium]